MKTLSRMKFWIIGILTIVGIIACVYLLAAENRQRAILEKLPSLEMPLFSMPGGFYDQEFYLEINAPTGCQIYYTLDGSDPDPASEGSGMAPQLYEAPILITAKAPLSDAIKSWLYDGERSEVQNAATLRAICVNEAGERSKIATATYLIGEAAYEDRCVVSIVMDPDDLFGEQGIYTNYEERGRDWERGINLEIFDKTILSKNPAITAKNINQPAGIRIQGSSARKEYAKRFSVYSRKEYSGSKTFDQIFLGNYPIHSFVLREGFRNAFIQHLIQDRDIASADAKEAVVLINGCFWYTTMLQEKYNSTYFENRYGFKKDNVILIKGGEADSGDPEDLAKFEELYTYLRSHDLSEKDAYEGFGRLADIQSYIDFSCVNLYFGNLDYNERNNIVYWRSKKAGKGLYEDTRWRWGLYDLDLENLDYGYLETDVNTFSLDTHYSGEAFNKREMYVALKENRQFCRDFVNTFMDLINTTFAPENARKVYDAWNCTPAEHRMSDDWCEEYFPARNEKITAYIQEEFDLGDPVELCLQINDNAGGTVTINTISPAFSESEPAWSGLYFPDCPVTLTATPAAGYRFEEWIVNSVSYSQNTTIELNLSTEGNVALAVFSK